MRRQDLGLPVSAFMDRDKPTVVQSQLGFIAVLVKPLYAEWRKLLGDEMQVPRTRRLSCQDVEMQSLHTSALRVRVRAEELLPQIEKDGRGRARARACM